MVLKYSLVNIFFKLNYSGSTAENKMLNDKKKEVIRILKNGGIGVMPTDTIYGLVGSAFSKKAVERINQTTCKNII